MPDRHQHRSWLLVAGCWLPVAGYPLLAAGYPLPAAPLPACPGLGYAADMSASSRDRAMVELILHELRTPLTVASGSVAQAADERAGALSAAQRAHLERARRACASLELG